MALDQSQSGKRHCKHRQRRLILSESRFRWTLRTCSGNLRIILWLFKLTRYSRPVGGSHDINIASYNTRLFDDVKRFVSS